MITISFVVSEFICGRLTPLYQVWCVTDWPAQRWYAATLTYPHIEVSGSSRVQVETAIRQKVNGR